MQVIPKTPGTWLVRVYAGRDAKGKRRYVGETVHGTFKQAQARGTAMEHSMNTGTFIEPTKTSLESYLGTWLAARQAALSPKTYRDYKHLIEKHINPSIGRVLLSKLSALDIQRTYGSLTSDRHLSSRTVRYTHSVLSVALTDAVELNYILKNPALTKVVKDSLPKKTKDGSAAQVLSFEETAKFLNHNQQSGDRLHALWRLLLTAGLRPQEALALQWADLSSDAVTIRRALVESKPGCWTIGETKTEDSVRTVTLSQETLDALQRHREAQDGRRLPGVVGSIAPREGSVLVFSTSTGHHFDPRNIRRWWKAALTNAAVREVRLYDARHTSVSHHLAVTGNPRETADRHGHADPSMTLRVYSHTMPALAQAGPAKVEAALRAAGGK